MVFLTKPDECFFSSLFKNLPKKHVFKPESESQEISLDGFSKGDHPEWSGRTCYSHWGSPLVSKTGPHTVQNGRVFIHRPKLYHHRDVISPSAPAVVVSDVMLMDYESPHNILVYIIL